MIWFASLSVNGLWTWLIFVDSKLEHNASLFPQSPTIHHEIENHLLAASFRNAFLTSTTFSAQNMSQSAWKQLRSVTQVSWNSSTFSSALSVNVFCLLLTYHCGHNNQNKLPMKIREPETNKPVASWMRLKQLCEIKHKRAYVANDLLSRTNGTLSVACDPNS